MSRRFLTAEDVRRAAGREIVVEEGTVVTPQARDAAAAAGIAIRTARGPYVEPPPDRGPDAPLALRHLPHIPEPTEESAAVPGPTTMIVTAVGRNRPGVLAEITTAIAGTGASIKDVSQKMVEEFFHMVLVVELPEGGDFHALKTSLECMGGEGDYVVRAMHERVFRFMHRI